ncbi:ZIP family metal transporter [Cellvibrio japonicus]|uniref:GufA protein n=1 Tax=Cellvibrio japonicus (strain Ueda107) TaxID=498211 RepID=B3PBP4_CELJU|nr:ZIP family metal transporter [Cellvibrio japonicus]ACE84641.1 gufA protein [Cellvibrio japonicus Ueda107]QEI11716.1 ZIP family metal transporter [Cellvibrio japonicus]QEI15290.1 ZIP family metal transporter [Cellvibrio japonicus]QEI18870.1 ZIP family metal transporter [Cellvibrio japonicus]
MSKATSGGHTGSAAAFLDWIKASLFRRTLGLLINLIGLVVLVYTCWGKLQVMPNVPEALVGGLIAAGCTALGAASIVFFRNLSARILDSLLGFGAGVMLAASVFSLILPGLDAARGLGMGSWQAACTLGVSVLFGSCLMLFIDSRLPHEHFIKGVEGPVSIIRRTWLFVFAITLHNLPEGLAIGVAYASGPEVGKPLMTGISIQDIPEGLVVAIALVAAGYSRTKAMLIGAASGLVEPLGAALGAGIVSHSVLLLPWGLGFAAGAMLFVVSHEIIPESHRKGHEIHATSGLTIGFILMMILDNAFQ